MGLGLVAATAGSTVVEHTKNVAAATIAVKKIEAGDFLLLSLLFVIGIVSWMFFFSDDDDDGNSPLFFFFFFSAVDGNIVFAIRSGDDDDEDLLLLTRRRENLVT